MLYFQKAEETSVTRAAHSQGSGTKLSWSLLATILISIVSWKSNVLGKECISKSTGTQFVVTMK